MTERLHKFLARAGVSSRRRAEEMIARGDVTVNGRVARVGQQCDPLHDRIEVRGRRIDVTTGPLLYLALNKPRGCVTSLRSTHGELTIRDLIDQRERVFPVGRLDKETSGLLLLTNDGEWANIVTHPRHAVEKEYIAVVRGKPSREVMARLRRGVELPDGTITARAKVEQMGDDRGNARIAITVIEGKKRQIRLMARTVGHPVIYLCRVRVGPIVLGNLAEGRWRYLREKEVDGIREHDRERAGASGA